VTSDETTASRKNGNTDGIEAYRGGGLRASPREEVRERIRTFISLGDKQGWDAYNDEPDDDDDDDDKGYDYEWTPELLAIAAEYGQEQALAKLFASSRKNGHSTSKRPKGFAGWNPHKKTRIVVSQVEAVLREYRAQLPLTARQIFYRLVGAHRYPKDERAYERLTNILVRARRARLIPFEYIRDDGASVIESEHYENKEQFYRQIREMGENFTRDKLARQGLGVRIYCEAAGMMPQISNVSDDYSIPVYSCSGFDSLTAKYDLFRDISRAHTYHGRRTVVLHLGDYDPSGESIFDAIAEDVHAFLSEAIPHKRPEEIAMFDRVALTRDMVVEYSLPTAPPKASDSRSRRWAGGQTCQLEALPPDTLADIIRQRIENLLSGEILEQDREQELEDRQIITKALPAPGDAS
jgi:hypothetical protein